jgi:hypothetical protein
VWEHAGVTKLRIIFKGKGQVDLILIFETTLSADATKLTPYDRRDRRKKPCWIQDQQSRITIFASEMTDPSNEKSGTVAIAIAEPIRIRILVEDVDTFHEGGDQVESYFSTLMVG